MKTLIVILMAILLTGCGTDEQSFDIRALHKAHKPLFRQAMRYWNEAAGSHFNGNDNGPSDIVYGYTSKGDAAEFITGFHHEAGKFPGDRIILDKNYMARIPDNSPLCGLMRHELGHSKMVYGTWHSNNPAHPMHPTAPPCDN